MESWLNYLTQIAAAVGAVILAFLTPFAAKFVERRFGKRPSFSVRSPVFRNDLRLIVEPANKSAVQTLPLGVTIRGLHLSDAGQIHGDRNSYHWIVDLSKFEDFRTVLKVGEDYSFQFYFDVDRPSEPMLVRYIGGAEPNKPTTAVVKASVHVKSTDEFLGAIEPNRKIIAEFSECILNRTLRRSNAHMHWSDVFDGKELTITNVSNLELEGRGRIVIEPRYAWVINFRHCHSIAIRGLTLGHTDAGYCQGGVLRFESCSNIFLEKCEFFGCGTYGLEFVDCEKAEIAEITIRNCTYGIANFQNVNAFHLNDCEFRDNRCFDGFNFRGDIDLHIRNSRFTGNRINDAFFGIHNATSRLNLYVDDSLFQNNVYPQLTNKPNLFIEYQNKFVDDVVGQAGWDILKD